MDAAAIRSFEDGLIEDMRAHDGEVTEGPMAGHPLLVLTSTGARSGASRRSILTLSRDGEAFVVAGTAGGSTSVPAWIHNVAAHPDVSLETRGTTFAARAEVIADGPERDRLWAQHVAALPHFADYPAQTGRRIPMVRITRSS
jgi:deazaflavin-dependent oxidoreductase (nitroreductase family)